MEIAQLGDWVASPGVGRGILEVPGITGSPCLLLCVMG